MKRDLMCCYSDLCDLLAACDEFQDVNLQSLSIPVRSLLIRIGFAEQRLAQFNILAAYSMPSFVEEVSRAHVHSFFQSKGFAERPWRHLAFDFESGGPARGFAQLRVLPKFLAEIYGVLSMYCAPPTKWVEITGGGGKGRSMIKFIYNRNCRNKYRRNQQVLEAMQKSIDLCLLVLDPDFWLHYAFAPEEVGFAILGTGFDNSIDALDQEIHTDMAHWLGGYRDLFRTCLRETLYPLAQILSLFGPTHLIVQPHSWGCENPTSFCRMENDPGFLFLFHGNLNHSGGKHTVISFRGHWYRPLVAIKYEMSYIDIC